MCFDCSECRKVYVGGIPYYSSEDDIRSFFEGCGTVTEVDCMTFPESGKFRGIAILTFKVWFNPPILFYHEVDVNRVVLLSCRALILHILRIAF